MILLWPNGASLQAKPWAGRCDYRPSIGRMHRAGDMPPQRVPGWSPFTARWIRITLRPDTFVFHRSVDGQTWTADGEMKRDAVFSGAPRYVMLGVGQPGENPHLANTAPGFSVTGTTLQTFYADMFVGRNE
jgi:hypothetical protein